eukprot:6212244-Pleurochrysis_carterae.AAC.5
MGRARGVAHVTSGLQVTARSAAMIARRRRRLREPRRCAGPGKERNLDAKRDSGTPVQTGTAGGVKK